MSDRRRQKRGYGMVEETQTESLETRQAKLQAVEDYKATLENEDRLEAEEDAYDYVDNMMDSLSLYSVFGDKLENVNGELVMADVRLTPAHGFEYGFDDVEELDKIRERARTAEVHTRDTKYHGTAKAMLELVDSQTGDIINELVHLSEGSSNMTF